MKIIDNFLDKITMYRLVLYLLILFVGIAIIYCFLGIIPYNPFSLIFSVVFFITICWGTNKIFSKLFKAPTNAESVYISALILVLIIEPPASFFDLTFILFAGIFAMASKYIFAINKKHIFNPVAIAVVLTGLIQVGSASWWVGNPVMLPFVLLGFLILCKLRKGSLFLSFLIAVMFGIFLFSFFRGEDVVVIFRRVFFTSYLFSLSSYILFFALVMLTEPQTTPPTKKLQIIYGVIVGILFAPQFQIGFFYTSPEVALIIGNIFSYLVSPKYKLPLNLKEKITIGADLVEFSFNPLKKLKFLPGQYMEWTLPHAGSDTRGTRRYFTIASSPTEETLKLGVRFYQNGSSFKRALKNLDIKTSIMAGNLSGDFVLPKDPSKKLVFIAGGIGITPFRSMIKYLIDIKQKRNIVLFFANKSADEIIYKDVFDQAQKELGIKTIYTLTDETKVPKNWKGSTGRINSKMINKEVPDFKERIFYLSGPHSMVVAYEEILKTMKILSKQIKKDFFPGYV